MRHNFNKKLFLMMIAIVLCCSSSAYPATCGNGIVEYPEVCDDGNVSWGVGNCAIDCTGINTVDVYSSPYYPYHNASLSTSYGGLDEAAIGKYFCGKNANYTTFNAATLNWGYCPRSGGVAVASMLDTNGTFGIDRNCHGGFYILNIGNIYCMYPIDNDPPVISLTLAPMGTDLNRVTFEGTAIDQTSPVSDVFYMVDGSSWVSIPKCADAVAGKSTIFSIVTAELGVGQHTILFKASDVRGNVSPPLVQTFNVNPPAGSQTVAIHYDDSLVQIYHGTPYNDPDPEENLHLYEISSLSHEIPIIARNKAENNVQAKTDSFDNKYVLIYKSPACLKNGL